MADEARLGWWRGSHGEWYVVGQVAVMALVLIGPRTVRGIGLFPASVRMIFAALGVALLVSGASLLIAGIVALRRSLTPLPYPRPGGDLVQTGPYGLVRHPMYTGGIIMSVGWALFVHSWFILGYAALLFAFVEVKSTREERWLAERFPEYAGYQERVPRLVPFLHNRRSPGAPARQAGSFGRQGR